MPEGKVEGAAQLVAHMQSMRNGPGNMKRHRRAELTGWESAQKEASVNAVYYNHLTVEFWVRPLPLRFRVAALADTCAVGGRTT